MSEDDQRDVSELVNQVHFLPALELLKKLPDESIDAFVSDIPYGLGSKEPSPEQIIAYLQGADLKTGDFMGKKWDIPSVAVWKEVQRVLKPGAHLLVFAGTRTWDLVSLGLRMGGLTNRDTIASDLPGDVNHPALRWQTSQGMPKSTNLSKQIDAKKGAKPTVLGPDEYRRKRANRGTSSDILPSYSKPREAQLEAMITESTTDEAKSADGVGTALKPTWEPVLVFRKPLAKGMTLGDTFLKHGTGGLNIDASRVKHASPEDFAAHKDGVDAIKARGGSMADSWKNSSDLSGANDVTSAGRWPPNSTIVHALGCKRSGTKQVKTGTAYEKNAGDTQGYNKNWGRRDATFGYADENGTETIEAWVCVEGCPARALNEQSGNRKATLAGRADPSVAHTHPGHDTTADSMWFGKTRSYLGTVYADEGGAAKYFPQFEFEKIDVPFLYMGKATKKDKTLDGQLDNTHPTVKPLGLMRWLVKLVTPKNGIVLDLYCGSGTTLHAAHVEGFRYIGCDYWEEAFNIATKRMEIVSRVIDEGQVEEDLFELMMELASD